MLLENAAALAELDKAGIPGALLRNGDFQRVFGQGRTAAHGERQNTGSKHTGSKYDDDDAYFLRAFPDQSYDVGMTLRPTPGSARHGIALDYEIAQEQASALGRLGRALERRSRRWPRMIVWLHTTARPPASRLPIGLWTRRRPSVASVRSALVQAASHALWCFMVQREACGLRDPRPVLRDYRVPAEVQNRMGMVITSPFPSPRRRPKTP